RALRERVTVVGPRDASPEELVTEADVVALASGGPHTAPRLIRTALASGTVPVASDLPQYVELTRDGEIGLHFPPGDAITLAGQLERLGTDPELREGLVEAARGAVESWEEVAGRLEEIYKRTV